MKTKEEIKQWLLENAVGSNGLIDLSHIDFDDNVVDYSWQRAEKIFNYGQSANEIYNYSQQADEIIYNSEQNSKVIFNRKQKAYKIDNTGQLIKPNYDNMSKEELIEELKKRDDNDNN